MPSICLAALSRASTSIDRSSVMQEGAHANTIRVATAIAIAIAIAVAIAITDRANSQQTDGVFCVTNEMERNQAGTGREEEKVKQRGHPSRKANSTARDIL